MPEEEENLEGENKQEQVSAEFIELEIANTIDKCKKEHAKELATITNSLQGQIGK